MKKFEIKGTARQALGKKDSKQLRAQDLVPCVLYGGEEPIHFFAPESEFRKLVYTPKVYQAVIDIDGKVYNAFMQELQFHPVTDKLLHIDFLEISDKKAIKVDLPVKLEGYAKGIQQGGRLKANLRTLKVKGNFNNLPDEIVIDVTNLGIGESIRVGDIKAEGFDVILNKSVPVATVVVTRAARAAMNAPTGKK
ncbi:MAG: 50S ribosomal protein L25/general stress protein Ctc [Marinilabiliales bacterium]|nr:50S ribosomal protein L25/general stress protein Ctc [Marinilabiliales bacterium]